MKIRLTLELVLLLMVIGIWYPNSKGQEGDEFLPPDNVMNNEQLLKEYGSYCNKVGFRWEIVKQQLPATSIQEKRYKPFLNCWIVDIYNKQLMDVTFNIANGNLISLSNLNLRSHPIIEDDPSQLQAQTRQKAEEYILKLSSEKIEDLVLVETQFGKWNNYWEFEWRKKYGQYRSHDRIVAVVSPDLNLIFWGNYLITTSPRVLDARISKESILQLAREYAQLFFNEFSKGRESLCKQKLPINNKPRQFQLEVFHPSHISHHYDKYLANIKNVSRLKESSLVWEVLFLEKDTVFIRVWIDANSGELLGVEFG